MAQLIATPTGDSTLTGTWSGSASTRYTLVDDYPDSSGADSLTHGTTAGGFVMTFAALAVPGGASINYVEVQYYDQKTAAQAAAIGAQVVVGGTGYNASTHNPANGTWTSRADRWTTNPRTTVAWTVSDVNGLGSNNLTAFGWTASDANPTILLASIRLVVDYSPLLRSFAQIVG